MDTNPMLQTTSVQPSSATALPGGAVLTQISTALVVIILLILLAGWLFRRFGLAPQKGSNKVLQLRASCQLGQRERVVVIEVEDTWLVLGITAHHITPLHKLPLPSGNVENTREPDFQQLIQQALPRSDTSA